MRKKRKLLSITVDDETQDVTTSIECHSREDIECLCNCIAEMFNENEEVKRIFLLYMIRNTLCSQVEESIDIQELPDFEKILREAKVDPNNHIKE